MTKAMSKYDVCMFCLGLKFKHLYLVVIWSSSTVSVQERIEDIIPSVTLT